MPKIISMVAGGRRRSQVVSTPKAPVNAKLERNTMTSSVPWEFSSHCGATSIELHKMQSESRRVEIQKAP